MVPAFAGSKLTVTFILPDCPLPQAFDGSELIIPFKVPMVTLTDAVPCPEFKFQPLPVGIVQLKDVAPLLVAVYV
jgi:hypothetical protein